MSLPLQGEHHGNEVFVLPQTDTPGAPARLCETLLPGVDRRWGEFLKKMHLDIWGIFNVY